MQYALPDLPYDPAALEPAISGEIIELHHGKHHAAYVKGANDTLDKLAAARGGADTSAIPGLERSLAFNVSGHVLHSLYWTNMSPDGGDRPDGDLGDAIAADFGSFDGFRSEFSAAANTVQGSGWSALVWDPVGRGLLVAQLHDHQSNGPLGAVPLLVLDMWEHAFYLQYRNVKADYVTAWWDIVNWADVAARFEAAASPVSAPV
jgi:Fe-Mn family superoxide dismutase